MKIDVTPETEAVIRAFMASGKYENEAQALQAALDERIDPESGWKVKELRDALQRGIDQLDRGEGIPHDQVWARIQQKLDNARD